MYDYVKFEELKGKVLERIDVIRSVPGKEDEIVFVVNEDEKYKLSHYQDCCEDVTIEDICGDIDDLIGVPIVMAEEASNDDTNDFWPDGVEKHEYEESYTWTFYKLATIKGYVTIRWYGQSNGYYSEDVNFERISKEEK